MRIPAPRLNNISFIFLFSLITLYGSMGIAQTSLILHPLGSSSSLVKNKELIFKGIILSPFNPMSLKFILSGGELAENNDVMKKSNELLEYFVVALTLPSEDLWVNLSPFEKDRIITKEFSHTAMGQVLLKQDFLLKKFTVELLDPNSNIGKVFWEKVRLKHSEFFGNTDLLVNSFNKVWIAPLVANVDEFSDGMLITNSTLKVFLEEDYWALKMSKLPDERYQIAHRDNINPAVKKIIQELIIPIIEHEVNYGKRFAELRQIYSAIILANWYKGTFHGKDFGQNFFDNRKMGALSNHHDEETKSIYSEYVLAYRKGDYDFIKEVYDEQSQEIRVSKYFTGGVVFSNRSISINSANEDSKGLRQNYSFRVMSVIFSLILGGQVVEAQVPGSQESKPTSESGQEIVPKKISDNEQWFSNKALFRITLVAAHMEHAAPDGIPTQTAEKNKKAEDVLDPVDFIHLENVSKEILNLSEFTIVDGKNHEHFIKDFVPNGIFLKPGQIIRILFSDKIRKRDLTALEGKMLIIPEGIGKDGKETIKIKKDNSVILMVAIGSQQDQDKPLIFDVKTTSGNVIKGSNPRNKISKQEMNSLKASQDLKDFEKPKTDDSKNKTTQPETKPSSGESVGGIDFNLVSGALHSGKNGSFKWMFDESFNPFAPKNFRGMAYTISDFSMIEKNTPAIFFTPKTPTNQ